jgi:PhzF family phenazine biosynthesis protein
LADRQLTPENSNLTKRAFDVSAAAKTLRFLQLDVFTRTAGGGNPLGVVLGANAWTGAQMQAFARWANLVETTFLLPATAPGASYQLRIFSPSKEIPFAGHPTIGSAHAALETGFAGLNSRGELVQQCAAGLLNIRADYVDGVRELYVAAPGARVLKTGLDAHPTLGNILSGVNLGVLPPAFVDGGRRWWLAEIASEAELRAWKPDHASIAVLAKSTESMGLCVFARADDRSSVALLNTSAQPAYKLVVRAFPAGVGIVEDPASGAANGLLAAFIQTLEADGELSAGYDVSQGREMGHNATLKIRFDHATTPAIVWVGGQTHTVVDGQLYWQPDLLNRS